MQSAYYTMEQNRVKYLFLAIPHNKKQHSAAVSWGNEVIRRHPNHRVFVTIHKYMDERSRHRSTDHRSVPDSGLHKKLILANKNVEFLTCGHYGSETNPGDYSDIATSHRSDRTKGVAAHQILFNAQFVGAKDGEKGNGGDGWLLLMEFTPDNRKVKAKTYSPYLKKWRTGDEYEYVLKRN